MLIIRGVLQLPCTISLARAHLFLKRVLYTCISSAPAQLLPSITQETSSKHQQGGPPNHQQPCCYAPLPRAAAPPAHRSPHASAGCEPAVTAAAAHHLHDSAHGAVPAVTAAGAPRTHGVAHAAVHPHWADDVPAQCHQNDGDTGAQVVNQQVAVPIASKHDDPHGDPHVERSSQLTALTAHIGWGSPVAGWRRPSMVSRSVQR